MWRKSWFQLLLLTVFALGVRLIWGASQLAMGTEYVDQGDYILYFLGAQHFLTEGDFSNSLFLVRPPGFSLIIALLNLNNWAVLIVNSLLGALLTPLTYVFARQLKLSQAVAQGAAFLVAVDPLTVRFTAFLGPEPLALIGALGMMVCLMKAVRSEARLTGILWGIAAAAMFLVSVYARPSIYFIWLPLVVWLLFINRRAWPALAVFVILNLIGMQLWVAHNGRVFNNPTFSTVAAYTMTYYRASSVANLATDMNIREVELEIARRVEEKLGRDPSLVDEATKHGYLAASPEVERALTEVSIEIIRQYPLIYIATFPVGFLRLYQLVPPSLSLEGLSYLPLVLWNWLVLVVGVYGMFKAVQARQRLMFWGILLLFGYFTAGTLVSKSAGLSGRERAIIFPFIAIACAYGFSYLWLYLRPVIKKLMPAWFSARFLDISQDSF